MKKNTERRTDLTTFFTSDIHFSDERIMKLCKRPFSSASEMDEYIVRRWNERVSASDTVWILGDTVDAEFLDSNLLNRLSGNIILLSGNHDYNALRQIESDTKIKVFYESAFYFDSALFPLVNVSDHNVVMCHFPIMEWNGIERGSIHLYGHVHNKSLPSLLEYYKDKLALNVCMDVNNFEPRTLKELVTQQGKLELYRSIYGESVKGFDF